MTQEQKEKYITIITFCGDLLQKQSAKSQNAWSEFWRDLGHTPETNYYGEFTRTELLIEAIDEKNVELAEELITEKTFTLLSDSSCAVKKRTELIAVLAHKSGYWHDKKRYDISTIYAKLYEQFDGYCIRMLASNKEESQYYFETLD